MGARDAIVLLAALAACYGPSPASGVPCADNGQCPAAQLCDHSHNPPICVTTLPSDGPGLDANRDGSTDSMPPDAPADGPPSMLKLVQQITNQAPTGATVSATLGALPASGNVLLMIGQAPQAGIVTVTGGGVTSWTRAAGAFSACDSEIWFGVTNGSSGTVTIGLPSNTMEIFLNVSEWSGLNGGSLIDGATNASGKAGPVTPAPLTTTHANDLLMFVATDNTPNTFGTVGPGTWTPLMPIQSGSCVQDAWYSVASAIGTFAPTVTQTGGHWDTSIVGFRIAP
jgi:hypothetical protein